MKYSEFLSLDSSFHPVFDITNEIENMWKRFIPTPNFYDALSKTLDSLEGNEQKNRLSIWLQGSYGTGKSHSTSVIKHLLSDNLNMIDDFLIKLEENIQIKKRLENFRQNHKICPVILKGSGNIKDNSSFSLAIQASVKKAFPFLTIKNDFETLISHIEDKNSHIDWNSVIDGAQIKIYVNNINGLVTKLKENDLSIYTKLVDYLSKKNTHISTNSLNDWLKEVIKKLKEEKICDKLVIFWDEFTSILESPYINSILINIQNLAELSFTEDIFLYVITHRTPYQVILNNEDINRIKGRFKEIRYEMENITTYHIINAAIIKRDKEKWENIKNSYNDSIKAITNKIVLNKEYENIKNIQKKDLENLFPIHPYTAYLLTFISRYLGSSERSIFNFIFDDKNGFRDFISKNPENGDIFLTADLLWDFFYNEFENMDNDKTSPSITKWKLYRSNIIDNRSMKIFESILLLNILYRYTSMDETSLAAPSKNNIISIFEGVFEINEIEELLKQFEDIKTPNDLYLFTSSVLNIQEVENEIKRIKDNNEINIKNIVSNNIELIKGSLTSMVFREVIIEILPPKITEIQLESILRKYKKNNLIKVLCFFGVNDREIFDTKEILEKYSKDNRYENIVFLISENPMGEENFSKYIENIARANIAEKHNYIEDNSQYKDKAKDISKKWINKCLISKATWYLGEKEKQIILNTFSNDINNEISKIIFSESFDVSTNCTSNKNLWERIRTKKFAEIFIFANNRKDIEDKTNSGLERYIRYIVMNEYDNSDEWIINNDLKFKQNAYNSPLYKIFNKIEKAIKENKDNNYFNLAETLGFLFQPPYGFYSCRIFFGAMGFLLRNYIGQLYDYDNGYPIDVKKMLEKIESIFDYWENEKQNGKINLNVRLGSIEEKKLINNLKTIFCFDEVESLNDIKWKIREKIKSEFPFWIYKYNTDISKSVENTLEFLDKFIKLPDENININLIKSILDALEETRIDIINLLNSNQEIKEQIFNNAIQSILIKNNYEANQEVISSVTDYLRENMQEERGLWEEDKVENKIKDWYIDFLKIKNNDTINKNINNNEYEQQKIISNINIPNEEKVLFINKLKNYDAIKLKELIINYIIEDDEFAKWLLNYLGNKL